MPLSVIDKHEGLPCGRKACAGAECGHFNQPDQRGGRPYLPRGCMGWEAAPWGWAAWYNTQLQRIKADREAARQAGKPL